MEENRLQFADAINESEKLAAAMALRQRWPWVEPQVWSDRMLTALEQGVKGGRWYCLMDKVLSPANLQASFAKVARNDGAPGVDHVTVKQFSARHEEEMAKLHRQLRDGSYRPQAVKRVHIPKPGSRETRPLGIPTVRDRVVQGALRHVLEPIFERDFAEHSYGFRPGRGCRDALRRVDELLKTGHVWVVDADLKGYFDSIPHEALLERVRAKVSDRSVLGLVEMFLKQGIFEDLAEWTPEAGTPQGAVISPLLANLYLDPLDHHMAAAGFAMVRYADDFVVLCRSRAEAERALERIHAWTDEAGLALHPDKTRLVDASLPGGFDFLGYHFERGKKWPRKKSEQKFRNAIRAHTGRLHGHSLETIVAHLNPILRGWFAYFKHSHKATFPRHDKWIRKRLRRLLNKRRGLRNNGQGYAHKRWPIAYFARLGLFSLQQAHADACRSARR